MSLKRSHFRFDLKGEEESIGGIKNSKQLSGCPFIGSLPGVFEEQSTKVATTAYVKGGRSRRDRIREVMRARVHKTFQAIEKIWAFLLSWMGCYWRVISRAALIKVPNTSDVWLNV